MKAIEISDENLEDLLVYDDLFLDYFNAFLALPAFPQALFYSRLRGTFQEAEGSLAVSRLQSALSGPAPTPPYGATDEERDVMLEWAREERLPLFLRTQLFREFKLCKLLLRPLDVERHSASRGGSSRAIRGYSRQTESYVSSLSNSGENSGNEEATEYEDSLPWTELRKSALYKFDRPGSRALSLPGQMFLGGYWSSETEGSTSVTQTATDTSTQHPSSPESRQRSRNHTATIHKTPAGNYDSGLGDTPLGPQPQDTLPASREITFGPPRTAPLVAIDEDRMEVGTDQPAEKLPPSPRSRRSSKSGILKNKRNTQTPQSTLTFREHSDEANMKRAFSAPVNYDDYVRQPPAFRDFDFLFGEDEPDNNGETYIQFEEEEEGLSDQQTENGVKSLEGKHKMSMQELKEQTISCLLGMESFKRFLKGTVGNALLNFWLDCEEFKDTMEENNEIENMASRNRLFRDIQDKYKMSLTQDAKNQLAKAASNASLSHDIFIRTQYDVLRRLRAYWVPRFLLHQERVSFLGLYSKFDDINLGEQSSSLRTQSGASCFFPSISFANSMSVRADELLNFAKTNTWDMLSKGGRRLDDRVRSARGAKVVTAPPSAGINRTLREKLVLALNTDKAGGGPFYTWLTRNSQRKLVSNLLFWEDAMEYELAEDRSADRLLRMCHAWGIFNKYVSVNAKYDIGMSHLARDQIHTLLMKARDFMEASAFTEPKNHCLSLLEGAWIRYLKEDLKKYLQCQIRCPESRPMSAEEFEVVVEEQRVVVRRNLPWVRKYPPSTDSERGRRLRTALSIAESIDEGRKAEQRRRAKERRQQMEKERKKAVRAAKARQKEAKKKKNVSFKEELQDSGEENEDEERTEEQKSEEPSRNTFSNIVNNKGMISMFKKYIQENESKEVMNMLNLYLDIDAYHHLTGTGSKPKKDTQAAFITKTYFEQGARKKVLMNDKVYHRLGSEKDRPRSPTLNEAQKHLKPTLEEYFQHFWTAQADELGVDRKGLASMSQAEIAMRSENDASLLKGWNKRKGKGGRRGKQPAIPVLAGGSDAHDSSIISGDSSPTVSFTLLLSQTFDFPDLGLNPYKLSEVPYSSTTSSSSYYYPTAGGLLLTKPTTNSRRKPDGRAQPTKEDKVEFLLQLSQAASGHFPLQLLYFYKYLVKHGEEDNFPLIDKDLFFYVEVQKFKECSHSHADEEMLRRKIQAIQECFLESQCAPSLQVDIPGEILTKTIRNIQRYLGGKDVSSALFDEAQYCVFKELLPYWAGFMKHYKPPEDEAKKPRTKHEKVIQKRLEMFESWETPKAVDLKLPTIPRGGVASFSFSLNDGIRWKDTASNDEFLTEAGTPGMSSLGLPPGAHSRRFSISMGSDIMKKKQGSFPGGTVPVVQS